VNGKVREAIQQAIARILVGIDGNLMIEARPGGLLEMEGISPGAQCLDGGPALK